MGKKRFDNGKTSPLQPFSLQFEKRPAFRFGGKGHHSALGMIVAENRKNGED